MPTLLVVFAAVLRLPGVRPVYIASVLGRLPMGALGLLFVLRTQEATGSYAAGGVVAAAEAIAAALVGPVLGRAVDRRGQRAVLLPCAFACTAATAAFAALPADFGEWAAVLVAAVAGASLPPLSACQRALWTATIEPRLRHSAYTLDSVVFELVYIAGPLLLVGGIGAWSLRAAVATCAACTLVGTLGFAATCLSRGWRPAPAGPGRRDVLGPLRAPGVRTLLGAVALFGLGLAPTEIAVAAFARAHGAAAAIGVLLALWGLGSMLGGSVAGHLPAPADPARRLAGLLLALGVLELPLALARSPLALGAALVVAGAALAPSLALTFQLLSEVAPPGTVTEAQTWASTAINAGLATGAFAGGWLVEHAGTTAALAVVPVVGLLAALVVGARPGTLRAPALAATGEPHRVRT